MKLTGHGCPHLEALLGTHSGLSGSYSTGLNDSMGGARNAEDLYLEKEAVAQFDRAWFEPDPEPISDEDRLRAWVKKKTDLTDIKVEVLVARIVRGLSYKEIAVEFGYADAGTAGRVFRDAIEMLQRGVKK